MTVPPALTWTCLFPGDASYLCEAAPTWLLEMLRPFEPSGRPVRISQGTCTRTAAAKHLDGQVVINPKPSVERELKADGFNYIRRFAVLPSLRHARWFIPLDSGRISAGAFSLYTPARRSARIKQLGARALALTGLPLWYRDHVLIASRGTPPIERNIQGLFPNTEVRLALSAGAPEPARNRKPSLAVLDRSGRIVAIAKIGNSDLSQQITLHESAILRALANESDELAASTPRLLFAGDIDGQFLLVQSALAGKPTGPQLTPAYHHFLALLRCGEVKPVHQIAMFIELRERLYRLGEHGLQLLRSLDSLEPVLRSLRVPSTIVHGDFTPWNLRRSQGGLAAFDWEYATLDGLPLIDETHFRLQVGYLLHGWSEKRAAHELHVAAAGAAPLIVMVKHATALQCIYLIDMLARLLEEGYSPDDEMLTWYRRLLARLAPARKEMALV
jgi:hypothetical protein